MDLETGIRGMLGLIEVLRSENTMLKGKLEYVKHGQEVIEKAVKVAYAGDWQDAPMPLTGDEASLWLRAQGEAYQHALEMMGLPSHPEPTPKP